MAFNRRRFLQASLGALLAPRAARAAEPALVYRPYLQNIKRNRAVVRWTTFEPGTARLTLVPPDGAERQISAFTTPIAPSQSGLPWRYRHEAVIPDLQPGTEYGYRVSVDGKDLAGLLSFRTAGSSAFQFLAIGDSGSGSDEQGRLAALMKGEHPALVVHTGDVGYPSGNYEAYERRYFDYYDAIMQRVPFYPCPGNHDYYEPGAEPYFAVHQFPIEGIPDADRGRYYSVEWGDAEFFSLDTNDTLEAAAAGRGDMLGWIDRRLKESRKFWRVVFFHHPPYPTGQHVDDPLCGLVRQHLVPILDRNHVPLVLNGHEHNYQRSRPLVAGEVNETGTVYVTTGGGGAELHAIPASPPRAAAYASAFHYLRGDVDGRALTVKTIGVDGWEMDSFRLDARPALASPAAVNSASFTARIGRGALVSVMGWQMSLETLDNAGKPLPGRPAGITVTVNGIPLPLLLVSPSQLNAILPPELSGRVLLELSAPSGTAQTEFEIVPVAPALFPGAFLDASGMAAGVIRAGDSIAVLATGMAAHGGPVSVTIGATMVPGRLAAGEIAGLQQVLFDVPARLGRGTLPVTVEAAGVRSNTVDLVLG